MLIDDADRRILRVIQDDPEVSMRELGEKTGLSHTPCWRRLKSLQERGVVTDKRYVLDPKKLGYQLVFLGFVKMKEHEREKLTQFEQAVVRIPQVLQCYSATGEYDYFLRVLAKSVDDYESTVKNSLVELPNVFSINTSLTLKEVKNTTAIPV